MIKRALLAMLVLFAALLPGAPAADACGGGVEPALAVSEINPDMPLTRFAAGRIGIVRGTYARSYLVVAFRWLAGVGLDAVEQNGALAMWEARLQNVDPQTIDPRLPAPSATGAPAAPSSTEPWDRARAAVLGGAPPAISVEKGVTYATYTNCLPDAFRAAAAALSDRALRFGAQSAEVGAWVAAEDQVFANCGAATPTIPAPLAPSASVAARADRDYQIASAFFYAGDYKEAERRFRIVGADMGSPWRPIGRYLVARALTRQALFAASAPDKALLVRAERELAAILADKSESAIHPAARRYLGFLRARTAVPARTRELGVTLARDRLGADFAQALDDYTQLLDKDAAPLSPAASDSDRLSAWIGVLQAGTPEAHERALRLEKGTGSAAWLVAALATAKNAGDARLDSLLAAAEATPPESPAFATVRFHRARILAGRSDASAFADATRARAALAKDEGPSTRNAFAEVAMRAAPTLDQFLANTFVAPAGTQTMDGATLPMAPASVAGFTPEAAGILAGGVPLADLRAAARSAALPASLRAPVAAAAWVRAELLDDTTTANELAQVVGDANPAMRAQVAAARVAKTDDARRLALVYLLLTVPSLGPSVDPWTSGPATPEDMVSSYGGYLWCPAPASGPAPPAVAYLDAAARATAERESKSLAALGAGSTFLANEAARLADVFPADPRVPEALHHAVRAGRFACRDAGTRAAGKRAFEALHKKYPASTWAKSTPYYY